MASITSICSKFLSNPQISFSTTDFKTIDNYNYGSVKVQLKRLEKYGIIHQLLSKRYILKDQQKALEFIQSKGNTISYTAMPPHKIRAKAHDLSIGEVDLSGEPLEYMLKYNMLTKPSPRDPAQNVGLKHDLVKKFNMVVCLKTGGAKVYPKIPGWKKEFLDMFSWCGDFIQRMGNIKQNIGLAINYEDLIRINPNFKNIPFEEMNGFELTHDGMTITLDASQFIKDGEICLHTDSIESTMSLADKITYGNRDLSQAMKETAFEKQIFERLGGIEQSMNSLVSLMAETLPKAIQEGVEKGIEKAFNNMPKSQPNKDDPMIG